MHAKFGTYWPFGLAVIGALLFPSLDQRPNPVITSATNSVPTVTRLPFELNGSNIFFQARVNNSAPLWLSLDTGASSGLLNLRSVRRLGLKVLSQSQATGAGGTVEAVTLSNIGLNINGARLENVDLQAVPLNSIRTALAA